MVTSTSRNTRISRTDFIVLELGHLIYRRYRYVRRQMLMKDEKKMVLLKMTCPAPIMRVKGNNV